MPDTLFHEPAVTADTQIGDALAGETPTTHYVEFRANPSLRVGNIGARIGGTVACVHVFNARQPAERRVALSFLGYDDDPMSARIGDAVRLFGSEEALALFLSPETGLRFGRSIIPGSIRKTPAMHANAVFFRDRATDRLFPRWVERSEERLRRRRMISISLDSVGADNSGRVRGLDDEALLNRAMKFEMEREHALEQSGTSDKIKRPHVNLSSDSTGQSFCLFVGRVFAAEPVAGAVNTYGLSRRGGMTVPVF